MEPRQADHSGWRNPPARHLSSRIASVAWPGTAPLPSATGFYALDVPPVPASRMRLIGSTRIALLSRPCSRGTPVVDSGNWMHTIRHPIQCHDASVCADIISKTGVVELHEDLLKSSNVKLMQQMLRRTDVDPEAEKRGRSYPLGWRPLWRCSAAAAAAEPPTSRAGSCDHARRCCPSRRRGGCWRR